MKSKYLFIFSIILIVLLGCTSNTENEKDVSVVASESVLVQTPIQENTVPTDVEEVQETVAAPVSEPIRDEPAPPKVKAPYDNASHIYGKWSMMGATVIVYQKNGRCYMVNYYGGNNYGDPELFYKTTFRGMTAFKNAEDPDDLYAIEPDGSLGGYYQGDKACSFPPIF